MAKPDLDAVIARAGFLDPNDPVAISFWIISIAMVASTVFFLMESKYVGAHWKTSLNCGSLVTLVAAVHYFYMREFWVQIHSSPILYRYIDWSITVPLQMIEFFLILSAVNPNISQGMFFRLLIGTVFMLASGYAGEAKMLAPAAGFAMGMCGWFFILFEIFFGEAGQMAGGGSVNEHVQASFNTMRFIVTIGWSIYPLGYFFGYMLGSVDASVLNLVYNLADFVNKIAFVLAIWSSAKSSTREEIADEIAAEEASIRAYEDFLQAKRDKLEALKSGVEDPVFLSQVQESSMPGSAVATRVVGVAGPSGGNEAADLLTSNRATVVKDITNPGPGAVLGGRLSQQNLKRVAGNTATVDAFVRALCCKLRGQNVPEPSPADAGVWAEAAGFFGSRIQGSASECPGRAADMSSGAAAQMRTACGQMEAAAKLINNRSTVVQDITNPGPRAVGGGNLTQKNLKRVDARHRASVDAMIHALSCKLLGSKAPQPKPEDAAVWVEAASYFASRIQASAAECPGRAADMSSGAAAELRTACGEMEAGLALMSNRSTVAADITNAGPRGVGGGKLTQTNLKRVDSRHRATVDAFTQALCCKLLGQTTSGPSSPADAAVWAEAAGFLASRIQGSASECPGRAADMSSGAAAAMRTACGQMEAAQKLMSNRATVVCDITNPGPKGVGGGRLSQQNLKRVGIQYTAAVDAMVRAVACRLLGENASGPSSAEEAAVWAQAASFLSRRIQASAGECPGRAADMSPAAAAALKAALAQI